MNQRKLTCLAGFEINITHQILKTKVLMCQSMANLGVEILFGKVTYLLESEIRKMHARSLYESENSIFHSGP